MDLMETHFLLVDREAYISSMVSRCGRRRRGRSVPFLSASRRWPIDRPATRSCTTLSSLFISPSIETFATEIDREKMAAPSTRINSCRTCSTRTGGGSKNKGMRLMLEAHRNSDSRCKVQNRDRCWPSPIVPPGDSIPVPVRPCSRKACQTLARTTVSPRQEHRFD